MNPNRAQALATAAQGGHLWPLRKLMGLHAGDVVKLPRARIEAFYAQNWAFARFLLEAEGGRYRARFRQLLADTAAGTAFPIDSGWEPATTRAVLARYLREDFSTIERGYAAFVMRITGGPGAPR